MYILLYNKLLQHVVAYNNNHLLFSSNLWVSWAVPLLVSPGFLKLLNFGGRSADILQHAFFFFVKNYSKKHGVLVQVHSSRETPGFTLDLYTNKYYNRGTTCTRTSTYEKERRKCPTVLFILAAIAAGRCG